MTVRDRKYFVIFILLGAIICLTFYLIAKTDVDRLTIRHHLTTTTKKSDGELP